MPPASNLGESWEQACPACGRPGSRRAYRSPGVPFLRCRDCRTLFDPEPLSAERLRGLYDGPGYFGGGDRAEDRPFCGYPGDYLANRANVERKFEQVLGHLERYVGPGRLVDVGAGPGFMLTAARRRGWEATGVDLNDWAAAYARDELGVEVAVGQLDDLGLENGELNAITMMDLIEHLPDPEALIAEAARVVREDGAIAILTPDAGSLVSRALGQRWPEVRRRGEHAVLFSVDGLSRLLARHGFIACGRHSTGKTASLATLAADVGPVAPKLARRVREALEGSRLGERQVEFDPRTKFCLYARRVPDGDRGPRHQPAKVRKRPETQAGVEVAILEELEALAEARRYCDWLFAQFEDRVHGDVAEVGAGIGTFSERILAAGARSLLLIEPEPMCADALDRRFAGDERVEIVRELLPEAPHLVPESRDLVVCQNVLEHVSDDAGAVRRMGAALRPGAALVLIVPAGPRLYGPLDEAYGHRRRYTEGYLSDLVRQAGLGFEALYPINKAGIPAWWLKNLRPGARVGPSSVRAYEEVVRLARPLEDRVTPSFGLSLVCVATRPLADPA
jgi:2-polyprenyl-3-methyl-5-hydroxy-6-metoxy-1,4-benzoquinol methylase